MKISELPQHWENGKRDDERANEYHMRVTLEDAARLRALAELYPEYSEEDILSDLVSTALENLPDPEQR